MQTNLKNQLPTNDSLILFETLSIRNKCNQKQAKHDWTSVEFPWISNWMQKIKITKHFQKYWQPAIVVPFGHAQTYLTRRN